MAHTQEHDGTDSALAFMQPAVREWFERSFPRGPTSAQARGWPSIAAGHDTLIAAPTGSGKTLAAFLVHIDRLYREAKTGSAAHGLDVVYVSPLKALVADIAQNLERPLREIREIAERRGEAAPEIRVAMRNGDTPASRRSAIVDNPPHILVTTPESLFLMVTAEKSRASLGQVRHVIVDEIHALARDKRGVHLTLTLERLSALCATRPKRTGLSATQRPLSAIARLLVGARDALDCHIIDEGHQRELDLSLRLPNRELEAVASTEQLHEQMDDIARQVLAHRTTLVFVNTRRMSERLAHLLAERLGEGQVAAHHGSLSKERRLRVEARLRSGDLRALVATASLELGIDIGPVQLVCQIGSPRSIATFLQRVGRSGHTRFATPKGRLYPQSRDDLVECTALLRAVRAGRLDRVVMPVAPLDILAQQIAAECAATSWDEDALFELVTRATPYAELDRERFDSIVAMLTDGIDTGHGKRAAYLHHDRVQRRLRGRRGARLHALTSGGAIPDVADYRVIEEPSETFVGTINEDFAIESMVGDVFLLGSTSWRIRRVERGVVRVVDARGALPSVPFWLGEAPARSFELSEEVSTLHAELNARLGSGHSQAALEWLHEEAGLDDVAAGALLDYSIAARSGLGLLPTQRDLIVERFFDESGGMQLVVHCPFGGRINRALGLLMRKRFCRSFDFELQAAANDDSVVLSLGSQHSFPLEDVRDFLSPHGVRRALTHAVLVTPMFQARWRWNLNRALIVLRFKSGRRNPPQFQRMEADDVMAAIFPSLAACQDNAVGPREIPDHPIVQQTLNDCLTEAMDVEGLTSLLLAIEAGEVRVHLRDTTEPSLLAHGILTGRPYTFLDDAPLEERRTRAVQLRRGLPLEARNLALLDPDAIRRVAEEATPRPRDADELHALLDELVVHRPVPTWQPAFDALVSAGRAGIVHTVSGPVWFAAEQLDAIARLFPEAQPSRVAALSSPRVLAEGELLASLCRAHLEISGPITAAQLAYRTGLDLERTAAGLRQLEQQGFALRGHFDASLEGEQYCARRLLARIHAQTQNRLRREIEPVTAQDYMRFLIDFHGVTPRTERRGPGGSGASHRAAAGLRGCGLRVGARAVGQSRSRLHLGAARRPVLVRRRRLGAALAAGAREGSKLGELLSFHTGDVGHARRHGLAPPSGARGGRRRSVSTAQRLDRHASPEGPRRVVLLRAVARNTPVARRARGGALGQRGARPDHGGRLRCTT